MSFFLLRPFSSIPHNIFCHISVPIVCHSGDLQTRARHTAILVINSLPLQLSKFFFPAFSNNISVSFYCLNKEARYWSCTALFGLSFVHFNQDWLVLLLVVTGCGHTSWLQYGAEESLCLWAECEAKKEGGGANLTLPFKGIFSITRRLSNRSGF